jgi:hypothetical protein
MTINIESVKGHEEGFRLLGRGCPAVSIHELPVTRLHVSSETRLQLIARLCTQAPKTPRSMSYKHAVVALVDMQLASSVPVG